MKRGAAGKKSEALLQVRYTATAGVVSDIVRVSYH